MKNKALFLDRDGIINEDIGKYVTDFSQIKFNFPIFDITQLARQKGYIIIIITNQAGVSRGIQNIEEVEMVHHWMSNEFSKRKIPIAHFYYCPHHPEFSKCFCRKPGTLNFEKAIAKFTIEAQLSLMIGDNIRDILPAKELGIKTLLIHPEKSEIPDFQFSKLENAKETIAKLLN
jgi:D-glycero-D-manno-heptose 1,7-bisphosphate phosphatase